ncbi:MULTISPECIES: ABC transporter substrate-binding protein [unclassified Mogibacterium]|uniref:ABC transporter substrate-binding protein n=1 Tax=unclassified Mogibacterium TaxID=2637482 RepID=UPI00027C38BE|nr:MULTISPECIES: ABC transporter substrate-binding protein [unclassified Mogibacterium]EJU20261.1 receptor family ligand-binding protein [Mogibacterium sp. CM50]
MIRNKRFKAASAMMLLLLLAVVLSGCTTFDNFKKTYIDKKVVGDTNTINIGIYEPSSGEFKEQGEEEIRGIELANSIYGNVNGIKINLVRVDNQSDINSAKTAIQNLIKMKPTVIIGSAGEANSMVASPYIEKAKIPAITPSAANPLITENNKYYFRASITESQRGAGLAEYAYSVLNSRKIATISIRNDSSNTALLKGFNSKLSELETAAAGDAQSEPTSSIVYKEDINIDFAGYKKLVKKIKKSGADVVFIPFGTEKADLFFKTVEKEKLEGNITFVGNSTWNDYDFTRMMKKHPNIKVVFPSDSVFSAGKTTTKSITAETQRFLIEYANKYGDDNEPTSNAALGYDSYLIAINAINKANSTKPDDIRKALSKLSDVRGVTGVFSFDKDGNPVKSVNLSTVKKGNIISLYVTNDTTVAQTMEKIK